MTATKGCPEGGTKWAVRAFMNVWGARGGFRAQQELFQHVHPIPDGPTVRVLIPRSGADGADGANGANGANGAEVTSFFCIYSVRDMLDTFPNNQNSHTRRQSPRLGWGRS